MILRVFKTTFTKLKPREIKCRDYTAFNQSNFENELKQTLNNLQITTYDEFEKTFLPVLNKHAPTKSEILRANHAQHLSKLCAKQS